MYCLALKLDEILDVRLDNSFISTNVALWAVAP